jgi:hypothetical protein
MIRKGCISTNKLPIGREFNSSEAVLNGTKTLVLSMVKEPSDNGIMFISPSPLKGEFI